MNRNLVLYLPVAVVLSQLNAATIFVNGYPSPISTRRVQLSQTLNYRATYRADFQYLLDPSCDGNPPAINIQCEGANMTILNTSDSSIDCSKVDDPTINGTLFSCITNCSDDECGYVYPASNASTLFDGPFGSVAFMCEGDNYGNVRASYIYLGDDATCTSSTNATQSRSYHAGRLGVSCLSGSSRYYVFDDTYFECTPSSLSSPINTQEGSADAYTCVIGNDCGGVACNITIGSLLLASDVSSFFDDCVEKTTTEIIVPPTVSPVKSSFQYTAQFAANWAVLYDPADAGVTCINAHGGAIVSCENGSVITFLSSTDTSMICSLLNDSELNCIGSPGSISNQFTQVNYICAGPAIPTTRVTFLQSESVCAALVQETATVSHAVALGVVCTNVGTLQFDVYSECASAGHQFYAGNGEFGFIFYFYLCTESATFSLGTSTIPQIIPNVTIRTDNNWLVLPIKSCFTFTPATQSPVSLAPVSAPEQPSASPIEVITSSPILLEMSPTSISTIQSMNGDDNNVIGIAIGCVVAGFVLVAVVGYFVFSWKRDAHHIAATKAFIAVEEPPSIANQQPISDAHPITTRPVASSAQVSLTSTPPDVLASTSPSNYIPGFKDQCRDVAGTSTQPDALASTSPSAYKPDFKDQCRDIVKIVEATANEITDAMMNDIVPIVNASGVRLVSEVASHSNEPHGQPILDL